MAGQAHLHTGIPRHRAWPSGGRAPGAEARGATAPWHLSASVSLFGAKHRAPRSAERRGSLACAGSSRVPGSSVPTPSSACQARRAAVPGSRAGPQLLSLRWGESCREEAVSVPLLLQTPEAGSPTRCPPRVGFASPPFPDVWKGGDLTKEVKEAWPPGRRWAWVYPVSHVRTSVICLPQAAARVCSRPQFPYLRKEGSVAGGVGALIDRPS